MIPEYSKLTHFWCGDCEKLLFRGHLKLHRFRKCHKRILEKKEKQNKV